MKKEEIMNSEDFKQCVRFHGHLCPGLAIGYRASVTAMKRLGENRSPDEEIVAIVETDACSADAVQVITGCTFGKGNFIYRDYGKMALTLLSRGTGRGVRVAMRPGSSVADDSHRKRMQRVMKGEASEDEKKAFQDRHLELSGEVLERMEDELFTVQTVEMALPLRARIEPSLPCEICKEPTMASKLIDTSGKSVCRGCLGID